VTVVVETNLLRSAKAEIYPRRLYSKASDKLGTTAARFEEHVSFPSSNQQQKDHWSNPAKEMAP